MSSKVAPPLDERTRELFGDLLGAADDPEALATTIERLDRADLERATAAVVVAAARNIDRVNAASEELSNWEPDGEMYDNLVRIIDGGG